MPVLQSYLWGLQSAALVGPCACGLTWTLREFKRLSLWVCESPRSELPTLSPLETMMIEFGSEVCLEFSP